MKQDAYQQLQEWYTEQEEFQLVEQDQKDFESLKDTCHRILELIKLRKSSRESQ